MKEAMQAVAAPFSLESCLKIAESQFSSTSRFSNPVSDRAHPYVTGYLDDITNLKDPDLFQGIIEEELKARCKSKNKSEEEMRDPAFVATTISAR